MNLGFAYIPGVLAEDGDWTEWTTLKAAETAAPAPAPKPAPQIPPPVWDTRPISAEACKSATRAMCGG